MCHMRQMCPEFPKLPKAADTFGYNLGYLRLSYRTGKRDVGQMCPKVPKKMKNWFLTGGQSP